MRTCYCRLRRNQHLYDTEASQVTRDITSGGTHHHPRHDRRCDAIYKGHRKTRITVQYLDYLAPVYKSVVLVVPMRAYDLVRGLPWFHKQNLDIDWARLTPCDHRVRVERRNDTDDYGSGIEGLTS
jgi:hypothetical protein